MSLGSLFGLTAAAVAGFVVINLLRFRALQRTGVRTEGRVVDAVVEEEGEGENLVVDFSDHTGTRHRLLTRGATTNWRRKIGQIMTVTYDPADPRRARIHADVRMQTAAGIVLALVLGAIGAALLLR